MARAPCLYAFDCNNSSGSKEHIWPAALGGRRTNKRILCPSCNERFRNTLDKQIADDFRFLNALVEVRSDHRDEPHGLRMLDSKTGEEFLMRSFKAHHEFPKAIEEQIVDGQKIVTYRLDADPRKEQAFLNELRARGSNPVQMSRTVGFRLIPRPLTVSTSVGGQTTFRAIARIALNFLAQLWPKVAHDPGIQPIKEFVLGSRENEFVFFDFEPPSLGSVPATPPLQHRVVIWIAADGSVCAHVTVFAVAQFSVHLGRTAELAEAKCVILDPSAPRAGDAAKPDQVVSTVFCTERPAHFRPLCDEDRDIFSDRMRVALDAAIARKWQRDLSGLLECLADPAPRYEWQRRQQIRAALEPFLQHILNVVMRTIDMLRGVEGLREFCDMLTADDPESDTGISAELMCVVRFTLDGMAGRIAEYMRASVLTAEALRVVLDGDDGIQIACHQIMSIAGEFFGCKVRDYMPPPVLARGT